MLIFDREIVGDTYTARIVADDEGIGRAAAHYGRHMLTGPVNIIEIQGRKRSLLPSGVMRVLWRV